MKASIRCLEKALQPLTVEAFKEKIKDDTMNNT